MKATKTEAKKLTKENAINWLHDRIREVQKDDKMVSFSKDEKGKIVITFPQPHDIINVTLNKEELKELQMIYNSAALKKIVSSE